MKKTKNTKNIKNTKKKASVKKSRNGRFSSFSIPQRILIIVAACGLLLYFIYQPVCMWYAAARDGQILQEEKTLYEQSIAQQQARVDTLNSDEGIKSEAREHGYAEKGEYPVTVEGLPSDNNEADDKESNPIPKEIEQAVLDEPDPFYVQILDFIFLYHKG